MMAIESRLHAGDRVRIRDYVDPSIYADLSTIGNEGVIKQVAHDQWGYPKVLIEWDRNHWTYNGAPDGWTFEDHFDIVEPKESKMNEDEKQKLLAALAQLLGSEPVAEEPSTQPTTAPAPGPKTSILEQLNAQVIRQLGDSEVDTTAIEGYVDERAQSISDAMELIEHSEAFVVVAVNKIAHQKAAGGVLVPMSILYNDNPMAELVAAVHLSNIASASFQEMVLDALNSE
jgi:hypothetical protein